ncbi:fimbria/pilus outer membrane usher protein [Aquitalea sp. LB_tupeE]|uniref:fimbria/pilus outer membrane usher protein n=1 Tax=Aquitalea sp. LB_tupeE TaxID=2748078 RepID=UPI0015B87BFE|nr:fimbria/pilus outer membrane usher protein [Aquitalea sp. LB_tupeE]NWK76798.1 fimbrial biogenesis outer membrane usher protein [Aquitalea sp. LB_tupeE]
MKNFNHFRRTKINVLILCAFSMAYEHAIAGNENKVALFDKSMLWGNLKDLDVRSFEEDNVLPDGTYSIDVIFNGTPKGQQTLTIKKSNGQQKSVTCVPRSLLISFGVKESNLPDGADFDECADISTYIPNAFYELDANELSLKISVPQINVKYQPRDYTPPEKWEAGVPAILLDYNGNTYFSRNNNSTTQNAYLSTKLGINVGDWQFRNSTSINWDKNQGKSIVPIESYLKRDIDAIQGQLIVGDSFTDGDLFDSVSLRGVRLVTDDRMKPVSETGYAPIVRGIAYSNAIVTIKQNGYILTETTVAPGSFEINDIPPGVYNGDLEVTVTEADGRKSTFTVPFSALARSLREGASRYNFSVGKVRNLTNSKPLLSQLTYQRGMSNAVTGNVGATLADGYTAFQAGSVFNTSAGAVGMDVTHSNTKLADKSYSGQSYRVSFNKMFQNSGTNITLAAYRYSTSGYLSVRDGLNMRDLMTDNNTTNTFSTYARLRSRAEININQSLTDKSSLYVNASVQNYWNSASQNTQYQAGYRHAFHWGSVGINLNQQRDMQNKKVSTMMLDISINMDGGKTFSSSLRQDTQHSQSQQINVSGIAGEDKKWNYNMNAYHTKTDTQDDTTLGGNIVYSGSHAVVNASTSINKNSKQMSLGASGSLIATQHGVFFGQSTGESSAIVEAKDADGAEVMPGIGVKINSAGYALVPSLMPYRLNDIQLQTGTMSQGVELENSSTQAVPRSGAVVHVRFKTDKGIPMLFRPLQSDGKPLPFGSRVMDEKGNVVGNIGQNGKLLARVKQAKGSLFISMADGKNCSFDYASDSNASKKGIQSVTCSLAQ